MATGEHSAPQPTLGDLERRLVALERELAELLEAPPALAQAPAEAGPGPPPPRRLEPEDYADEVAALVRFRDLIAAAAADLVADYDRILERLRARAASKG